MIQKSYLFEVPNRSSNDSKIKKLVHTVNKEFLSNFIKDHTKEEYLCICSGGTTSSCAKNNLTTIDLRKNYDQISFNQTKNIVKIGGGVLMGDLLNHLEKFNKTFPIGLSNLPGAGYILTGGISPLSRRYGLAIDNMDSIKGYLGNGDFISLNRNKLSKKEVKLWKAMKGAAPFISIITEIGLKTYNSFPILILEGFVNKKQLAELILKSEEFPNNFSLQWLFSEKIYIYIVGELKTEQDNVIANKYISDFKKYSSITYKKYKNFNDVRFFPMDLNLLKFNPNNHSEVISLLGKNLGKNVYSFIDDLIEINLNKPNISCYVASQQLGAQSAKEDYYSSYFVNRDSTWKPWIYSSWNKNNPQEKEVAIKWMIESWYKLKKYYPKIHLAQFHNHLPTHNEEIKLSFGEKLSDLKLLKNFYDPSGILPPL